VFISGRAFRFCGLAAIGALALSLACAEDPEDSIAEIRALQASGRYRETVDRLRALVDEDPDRAETNFLLGKALYRTHEFGLAVWPLRRAKESPEYAVDAGLLMADMKLRFGESREALAILDEIMEVGPDRVEPRLRRSWAYLRVGRHEDALADLDQVEVIEPGNVEVVVPRAMALIGLERYDEAAELLDAALEQLEGAEPMVRQGRAAGLCGAGAALEFESGDREVAEAKFNACFEQYPTDTVLVAAAIDFFDHVGKHERATEILREAFEAQPVSFRSHLIGRMDALGEHEEVERLLVEWTEEEPSPSSWFSLGSYYTKREDYQAAQRSFEQALSLTQNPTPMLQFAYGDTLIQVGDYERGLQVAEKMKGTQYGDLLLGRLRLVQGDFEGALRAFDAGIRLWPNNAAARHLTGQAAEGVGDFQRAMSEYRESVRADVDHTEAALDLAKLHEAMGSRQSFDFVGRYVRSHPDDPEGYVMSIRLANQFGRQDVVLEGLRLLAQLPGQAARAVAIEADMVAGTRGEEVAVQVVELSNLDLTDPEHAVALEALIEHLAHLGRAEEAMRRVAAALEAHPDQAVFHTLQARALSAAGRPWEEVAAAFERAIEFDGAYAPALAGLAQLREEAGQADVAIALYDQAAEADSDNPEYAAAPARILLAGGKTAEAEKRFDEMLKHHPRYAQAATELAKIQLRRGADLERAVRLAQRAVLLRGGPDALETLGWAFFETGKLDQSVKALSNALKVDPEWVGARYRLGLSLARKGDLDAAREAFRKVLESADAPQSELAQAELARLEGR
jgi:tetratricopeptide (TPR) repeat protein